MFAKARRTTDEIYEDRFWLLFQPAVYGALAHIALLLGSLTVVGWSIYIDSLVLGLMALLMIGACIVDLSRSLDNWMVLNLLTGSKYRLADTHYGTGRVVAKHATASWQVTQRVLEDGYIDWPYRNWLTHGETFLVVEVNHQGKTYCSGMRIDARAFKHVSEGMLLPIKFQVARTGDKFDTSLLMKIAC